MPISSSVLQEIVANLQKNAFVTVPANPPSAQGGGGYGPPPGAPPGAMAGGGYPASAQGAPPASPAAAGGAAYGGQPGAAGAAGGMPPGAAQLMAMIQAQSAGQPPAQAPTSADAAPSAGAPSAQPADASVAPPTAPAASPSAPAAGAPADPSHHALLEEIRKVVREELTNAGVAKKKVSIQEEVGNLKTLVTQMAAKLQIPTDIGQSAAADSGAAPTAPAAPATESQENKESKKVASVFVTPSPFSGTAELHAEDEAARAGLQRIRHEKYAKVASIPDSVTQTVRRLSRTLKQGR